MDRQEFNTTLGKFVKQKRLEKGWTQADLATKLGHNFQNVSRLERGEISPTLHWCYSLATAFDMDFINFMKEFEEFKNQSSL